MRPTKDKPTKAASKPAAATDKADKTKGHHQGRRRRPEGRRGRARWPVRQAATPSRPRDWAATLSA